MFVTICERHGHFVAWFYKNRITSVATSLGASGCTATSCPSNTECSNNICECVAGFIEISGTCSKCYNLVNMCMRNEFDCKSNCRFVGKNGKALS